MTRPARHRWQRPARLGDARRDFGWSRCERCGLQRSDRRTRAGRLYRRPMRIGWPHPDHGEPFRSREEPPCEPPAAKPCADAMPQEERNESDD